MDTPLPANLHTIINEIKILIDDLMLLCTCQVSVNISGKNIKIRNAQGYVNTIQVSEYREIYIQYIQQTLSIFILGECNQAFHVYTFQEDTGFISGVNNPLSTRIIDLCVMARDQLLISMNIFKK